MITIKKENFFKVLKPEVFKDGEILLGKYELWENNAMTPARICYLKNFGTKKDIEFLTYNTMWFGFNPETNKLELHCSSYGGMCGFIFNEDILKDKEVTKSDIECAGFTFNLIKVLVKAGIIEFRKEDL